MPALRSREAWLAPASPQQAAAAVGMVLACVQPGATDEQTEMLGFLVAQAGYTEAELAHAARSLPFCPVLDKKLSFPGGAVTAADFGRVIHEMRRLRAQLDMKLRLEDVNDLVQRYPDLLSADDFGICDYTAANTPLYRFSFDGRVFDRTPRPVPGGNETPGAERKGEGGTFKLGDLL